MLVSYLLSCLCISCILSLKTELNVESVAEVSDHVAVITTNTEEITAADIALVSEFTTDIVVVDQDVDVNEVKRNFAPSLYRQSKHLAINILYLWDDTLFTFYLN